MNHGLIEEFVEFYERHYKEEIAELAQKPREKRSLWVDYQDLWRYNPDLAIDFREQPSDLLEPMGEAVDMVDVPLDVDLDHMTIRVDGLNEEHIYAPGEIRQEHGGKYIGIRGTLERVTSTSDLPERIVFDCQRCTGTNGRIEVEQDITQDDIQEPYQCPACERQGPFKPLHDSSEWSDYAKVRLQARPDTDSEGKIPGYVLNDLIDVGGETGLIGRAGEPIVAYGVVRRVQKSSRGDNQLLYDHLIEVRAIEFIRDEDTINVDEHKEEFLELADRPDAVDIFAESIAPHLHETDAWENAMEFAVAYLFGAPRIDIDKGPTYRGDLHFLIVADYGVGKSTFKQDIEAYSPKAISKSTTALSSGVGLTAAAVKDDFGEGQWTIKPGLLVRANGGHLLLDEIDKGPDELTEMNDALEGEQVVDIEKAGKSATYQSRTGLLALGNPVDGRFDPNASISSQLGISETLLSRFDGIVTMEDHSDTEQDANIAETYGRAYTEAQEQQYGDRDEFDHLERQVPVNVGQAWIKYARENVNPLLRYEQFEALKEWYAEDVRQLNRSFAGNGEGQDMPVPATVRVLGAAVKMSIAFARVHLREEVAAEDVERAKKLGKRLVKQNWNGESFDAIKNYQQEDDIDQLRPEIVRAVADTKLTPDEIAREVGEDENSVREYLQTLKTEGDVIETNGRYYAP